MFRRAFLNRLPPWPSIALWLAFAASTGHAFAQGTPEQGFRIITTGTLGNCVACHALPGQRAGGDDAKALLGRALREGVAREG